MIFIRIISILILFIPLGSYAQAPSGEGYISTAGAKIYYKTIGSGNPIVVLHGGPGMDHRYLFSTMEPLAKKHKVIFYDQRGLGKSSAARIDSAHINIGTLVKDLEALRKGLGYKKITLLAHSYAGFIAMHYAIRYPEHVSALILMNSMPATSSGLKDTANEFLARTKPISKQLESIQKSQEFAAGEVEVIEDFYRTIFRTHVFKESDADKLRLRSDSSSAAINSLKIRDILFNEIASKSFDLTNSLQKSHIPTLVIHGDHDIVPESAAEEIANAIPNSEFVVLENCGHFSCLEKSKEFFYIVERFLREQYQN